MRGPDESFRAMSSSRRTTRGTYSWVKAHYDLTVWVDPARVTSYVVKFPLAEKGSPRSLHPFVLAEDDFPERTPVETTAKYRLMSDLLRNLSDVTQSLHYVDLCEKLQRSPEVTFRYMPVRSEREAAERLETYGRELSDSLRNHGYRLDTGVPPGLAAIGRHGEVLKSGQGSHRFCVARELGISPIPLRIHYVHVEWARRFGWSDALQRFLRPRGLRKGLTRVTHDHRP